MHSPTRSTATAPIMMSAIGIPKIIYIIPMFIMSVPNWKTSADASHATKI